MGTHALPDMYALSPRASGIHIRQIIGAQVITFACFMKINQSMVDLPSIICIFMLFLTV